MRRSSGVWSDAAAGFYADCLDRSDYADTVGRALNRALAPVASLLDLGAGSGLPGRILLAPGARWTAVEPNAHMRDRLARGPGLVRPRVIDAGWETLPEVARHDVVLCANIPGPTDRPRALLQTCRRLARRAVAWVVPAQAGPRGPCLSGLLPAHLHGEDETPGVDLALSALAARDQPARRIDIDWTFRALFPDRTAARRYFTDHYGDRLGDAAALDDVLAPHLQPVAGGFAAGVRKRSAILIWTVSGETDI